MNFEVGKFVKVKNRYAFRIPLRRHYGEIVKVNINNKEEMIKIKTDLRHGTESEIWLDCKFYDVIE